MLSDTEIEALAEELCNRGYVNHEERACDVSRTKGIIRRHLSAPPACGEVTRTTNIDEIVERAMNGWSTNTASHRNMAISAARRAAELATAAERERCAKVCESAKYLTRNVCELLAAEQIQPNNLT